MEDEIDLKKFIKMFWDRKGVMFLIIVFCIFLGVTYTKYFLKPEYKSTATIVLAYDTKDTEENVTVTQSEIALNDKLISTYTQLVKSDSVLKESINNLKLQNTYTEDTLRGKIEVSSNTNEQIIKISATNENNNLAAQIANEITLVFTKKATEAYKINNVRVLSYAEPSGKPSNVNVTKTFLICGIAGVVLAGIYVFIANALDNTVEDRKDIEEITKLNILAEIPLCDFEKRRKK